MTSFHALAAPLALMLPVLGQGTAIPVIADSAGSQLGSAQIGSAPISKAAPVCEKDFGQDAETVEPVADASSAINALMRGGVVNQIRIEQRVIIRISPRRPTASNSLLASLPQQSLKARYEERKMEKCIPVSSIAGVQTGSGSQLMLYLRDRRIVRLNLEKACRARDFYSGFYVEQSKDGKLCVSRDKLQSRTGANCEVARMRQLVAVSE